MTILQVFSPFFILRDYFLYFVHLESVFGNCVAVNDFCLKIGKYRLWSFLARFWLSPDGAQFFFTRIFTCYFISCLVNGRSPLDCTEIFFILLQCFKDLWTWNAMSIVFLKMAILMIKLDKKEKYQFNLVKT